MTLRYAMTTMTMTLMLVSVSALMLVLMLMFMLDFRIVMPKSRAKYFSKSGAQQISTDKDTTGIFLGFVSGDGPCAFYKVKLKPLISAGERTFCTSKLAKDSCGRSIQKPDQVCGRRKLRMLQRHGFKVDVRMAMRFAFVGIFFCGFGGVFVKGAVQ